ncbi:TetR/AcrR family transcriptional regulator [Actinoallomurus iriomotensis]|uniref:TetR family transcriptional regulator n=1 Tax=Actinoallomurus iriomotensis TaxID=478107 RepID=A0A9W6S763_9ACTN|nr:TetR/AcrR family transcriptional regulator [Actinoallomurus iriomotensis]GLY88319.1 TetR family transcriptional regulator [Actinoallomurus iriomotensis]
MSSTDVARPQSARECLAPCRRADASRNHERILIAARAVFVEHGLDASLDEVARRAGVGNATLYRHFGDREDLIRQVATHVIAQVADDAERVLAEEDDPFQALRRCVEAAAAHGVGAVLQVVRGRFVKDEAFFAVRDRGVAAFEEIMRRARESGQLRPDVTFDDVWGMLAQLTRPMPGCDRADFDARVDRYIELLLAGLRAPAPNELPGPSPASTDPVPRR